jgi:polyhydroxybutyrate depolymerase
MAMATPPVRRARVRAVLALALTLVLALVAAACSGDDDDTAGGAAAGNGATSSTTEAGPTTTTTVAPAPSDACTSGTTAVAPGDEKVPLSAAGKTGYYLRHVPPSHRATTPMPLVVDLHGYAESAEIQVKMSDLGAFGDRQGFVTVEPGLEQPVPLWDASPNSDDVQYISSTIDDVERTVCVDTARVYVTGLSNGAMMTSAIACSSLAERIAAVAPVAGVWHFDTCKPPRAVPVVAIHGTADPFLPYDGGLGPAVSSLPAPDGSSRRLVDSTTTTATGTTEPAGHSVPDTMAEWADRNGCKTTPSEKAVTDDVTRITFDCPPGAEVVLYRVAKGGHAWPGSEFSKAIVNVVGPTTMSVSANQIMWDFFEAHPLTK